MKISIILPTRGRKTSLKKSINSLRETCSRENELEFMLRMDRDDPTLQWVRKNIKGVRLVVGPRWGYQQLHRYVNSLSHRSTGKWLMLWNDDAIMETKDWDKIVESFGDEIVVLAPKHNHKTDPSYFASIFPIIPRKLFDILGHFSLNAQNDSWLDDVAYRAGIHRWTDIKVLHDRADLTNNNRDATFEERVYMSEEFISPEMVSLRELDAGKIRNYLESR